METDHQLELPRGLQVDFAQVCSASPTRVAAS